MWRVEKRRRKRGFGTAAMLAVALVAIALAIWSQQLSTTQVDNAVRDLPLGGRVSSDIAAAHLWYEEAVAGDKSVDLQRDVYGRIDEAAGLVKQAVGARSGAQAGTIDGQVLATLRSLQSQLATWRRLTSTRWQVRSGAGAIGSTVDAEYDAAFERLIITSQKLSEQMQEASAVATDRVRAVDQVLLALVVTLFGGLAVFAASTRRIAKTKNLDLQRQVDSRTRRLAAAEARTNTILSAALNPIITIDADGIITSANPATKVVFGYEIRELLGNNVSMLMPDPYHSEHDAYLKRYRETGEARIIGIGREVVGKTKSGRIFPFELSVSETTQDGHQLFVGVVRDLTEIKEKDRSVREQAELLDLAHDTILVQDQDGRIVLWNTGAERMYGWTKEEALGKLPAELLKTTLPTTRAEILRMIADGSTWEGEMEHTTKDGRKLTVESRWVARVDDDGNTTGILEINRDITDRKLVEKELQDETRKLRSILANMGEGVVVADSAGNFTEFNPMAETILGLGPLAVPPSEWTANYGLFLDDGVTPAPPKELPLALALTGKSPAPTELFVRNPAVPDGVWILVTARPLMSDSGSVQGAVAVFADITGLKETERAMAEARKAAEDANTAKAAFLANMSHEIRTPMNAVIGMTGLLLDTPLDSEQRDYAETIRSSGESLLTIINDILDFSKIESGKMDLERERFDLRECIEGVMDLVSMTAGSKGLDLAYELSAETPATLIGDITRVRQVLSNLMTNAVKFTAKGEVSVKVTAEDLGDQRYEVSFAVRDTGIGIPPDRLDRLFQSFSQVDASTTRQYGGTGLGLAISQRLCELMGGRIWVTSTKGVGSTFYFSIRADGVMARTSARGYETSPSALNGKRVLIVDDNETNRRILERYGNSWGMVCTATGSPAEALEMVERGDTFSIGILDMQMPDIDGLELARRIREVSGVAEFPLVMLTSLGRRESDTDMAAFSGYLTKPIKPQLLQEALAEALKTTEAKPKRTKKKAAGDPEMARRYPVKVLIAEDSAVNQKLALRLLEKRGYRADVAANGLEALSSLKQSAYDLVLMDVQMPEMDGLTATRKIRSDFAADRQPRIVAMTANALQGDREACIEAGMDGYISKPISPAELESALVETSEIIGSAKTED